MKHIKTLSDEELRDLYESRLEERARLEKVGYTWRHMEILRGIQKRMGQIEAEFLAREKKHTCNSD